jgi:hypothetical protein
MEVEDREILKIKIIINMKK